jgi:pimeloyl-ACP methyl ester carboxylesterase
VSAPPEPAPHRPSVCETLTVRGLRYNIRRWGAKEDQPVLFLHGARDSSITFQFLVDELKNDWCVYAPDWRGHGHTQWVKQGYWFHEFVADLDVIADALLGKRKFPMVGHSLGGNVATAYAAVRSDRLSHFVALDAIGPLTNAFPVDMPKVLDSLLAASRPDREHAVYSSVSTMATRLRRQNPRLTPDRAMFIAEHGSCDDGRGGRRWLFDPQYERSLPTLHTLEEWFHLWSNVRIPTLLLMSGDKRPFAPNSVPGEVERRAAMIPHARRVTLEDSSHNLHHDAPAVVAGIIERFLADSVDPSPSPHSPDHPAQLRASRAGGL